MTEFAGFSMPLQYSGILEEHRAVRTAAGLFDLSHMGEFMLEGPNALPLLQAALTNNAERLAEGQAHYTIMCTEDGGTIDDLIVYRLGPDHYMLCVNAANIAPDWDTLTNHSRAGAHLTDTSDTTALLALQGPLAGSILAKFAGPLDKLKRFHVAQTNITGVDCTVARTGYTGEDGFEIFVQATNAPDLFDTILQAGTPEGLKPCGLGARDTLRMEAALPLYGHELDRATSPLEAGLAAFVKFDHNFSGEAALVRQHDQGVPKKLVGIRTNDGKSIGRQGYPLWQGNRRVGVVTSGTYAPTFARPLALGYVDSGAGIEANAERQLEVEIRGRRVSATCLPLPFYRRTPSKR